MAAALPSAADEARTEGGSPEAAAARTEELSALQRQAAEAVASCSNEAALQAAIALLESIPPAVPPKPRPQEELMSVALALEHMRDVPGRIGLDIGGSLAKVAFMQVASEECGAGDYFGVAGREHAELSFQVVSEGKAYRLRFVSGLAVELARTLRDATQLSKSGESRRVVATGGGAYRFEGSMREALNVELVQLSEMKSLVCGLGFVQSHGPAGELFQVGADDAEVQVEWPRAPFPGILVVIGTGVSILRVDPGWLTATTHNFQRLGGTAIGGATFLALVEQMTSARGFDEALQLAQAGDPRRVSKYIGDIYSLEACKHWKMDPDSPAAFLGDLMSIDDKARAAIQEADIAAAVLEMVAHESVVITRAVTQQLQDRLGYPPPIFMVGGFLYRNQRARQMISKACRTMNVREPFFLRHSDFVCAMGSLVHCIENRKSWG